MKKAIEYLEEFEKRGLMSSITLTELILEVQRDTIDEVVKTCANKATLEEASDYGRFNEKFAKFEPTNETIYSVETYGHGDCGYTAVRISKDSILNCANILKEQLK